MTTTQTLNNRLPIENSSYRPQTLGKRVSDDSPHFIFRLLIFFVDRIFGRFVEVFRGFLYYFEELHIFGRHRHLLHEKLHHIDLISTLYDQKSGFPISVKSRRILFSHFFWPQAVSSEPNRHSICSRISI